MSSLSNTPVWQADGHVPAPVEHRGPDLTVFVEDNGHRYLIDHDQDDAWLCYDGVISEVVL